MIYFCKRWMISRELINFSVTRLYCSIGLTHFSLNICISESSSPALYKRCINALPRKWRSLFDVFNPRYVWRKEAGVQEIGGTRRGNGEKRRKESLPGASGWISVGISVATLFYVRDTVWATRGECVGVWRKASARQPLRFLPWCHQTNRTVCDVVHSHSWYSCSPYSLYSCRTHTPAHTRVHATVFARVSSPTNVRARTLAGIAGIRGICKIPTAHVTTNCCSADRPTHRRSVKL